MPHKPGHKLTFEEEKNKETLKTSKLTRDIIKEAHRSREETGQIPKRGMVKQDQKRNRECRFGNFSDNLKMHTFQ